jgi:hypothetical protein
MQRRTTVDVNPNIAGILSLFDPALDWSADLSGDEYESILKEFLVVNQEGSKDPRKDNSLKGDEIEAIREEWQRVRKNKNLEYRVAKKTISAQKLLNPSKLGPVKGGESGGQGGDLVVIKEKVVSIEALLGEQFKLQQEQAKDAKKDQEDKKRKLKERLLEGAKNVWGGIQKVAGAVIKPFQSIWSKIIGFIQTVILGRILYKILEWGSDRGNQKKIKSIFKFLKDWWPTLLTAYILFGTGFTRMAAGLVKTVIWGVGGLLKLIPFLKAALAKLKFNKILSFIPGGKGGMLLKTGILVGGALTMDQLFKDRQSIDEADPSTRTSDIQNEIGSPPPVEYKEGGFVSGPAGVDKVPAKLTAGEFVMSKGAVQKYGVDTLAGMNAAGGGTNRPTITNEYNNGGIVDRSRHYTKMGSPITNTRKVNYNNGGYVGKNIQRNIINNYNSVQKFSGGGLVQPIVEAGSINSYEDAIKAGVKVEDSVVGNMRYGSINWTEKLPKGLFGFFGKQKYQIMGTKWIVDGIGEDHNKILAMPTEDYVNKKMGWAGSSSSSTNVKPAKRRRGQGNKIRAVASKSGDPNLGPLSKKKPKVVVVNNPDEKVDASEAQLPTGGNRELPNINVTQHRSSRKMEVLGISP